MRGRLAFVTLPLVFLSAAWAVAQPPAGGQPAGQPGGAAAPPPGAQPQVDPKLAAERLDQVLDSWSELNGKAENVFARFVARKKYNNLNGQLKHFDGTAKFLKLPDGVFGANIAQFEFNERGWKQDSYEKFIFTGGFLYMFDPAAKELLVQAMPPPPPGKKGEDGPMPFCIFLLKKQDAKARFDLRVSQIDANYTYIEVTPKFPADKQEFVYARMVVMNNNVQVAGKDGKPTVPIPKNLVRELYWVEPNKAEIKWDIKQIELNSTQVARTDVANPATPPGWTRKNYEPPRQAGGPGAAGGPVIGMPTKVVRP